jgi:hypothetical protein
MGMVVGGWWEMRRESILNWTGKAGLQALLFVNPLLCAVSE